MNTTVFMCSILAAVSIGSNVLAAATSTTSSTSYEACLATIQRVSDQLGIAPINIVETKIMRIVRFPTTDGSVLVTCSKPDRKMVITRSTK